MCKSHTKKIGALKLSQQDVGKNCFFRGCEGPKFGNAHQSLLSIDQLFFPWWKKGQKYKTKIQEVFLKVLIVIGEGHVTRFLQLFFHSGKGFFVDHKIRIGGTANFLNQSEVIRLLELKKVRDWVSVGEKEEENKKKKKCLTFLKR